MNNIVTQIASVEINNEEYPKNTLAIETKGDIVIVKTVAEGKELGSGTHGEWKAGAAAPYATKALLITALRAALYV